MIAPSDIVSGLFATEGRLVRINVVSDCGIRIEFGSLKAIASVIHHARVCTPIASVGELNFNVVHRGDYLPEHNPEALRHRLCRCQI